MIYSADEWYASWCMSSLRGKRGLQEMELQDTTQTRVKKDVAGLRLDAGQIRQIGKLPCRPPGPEPHEHVWSARVEVKLCDLLIAFATCYECRKLDRSDNGKEAYL